METDLEKLEVIHNPAESRFEMWINGDLSKLDYRENGNTIVMMHVGVPLEYRSQGLAGKITQVGLEYAKEKKLRVIPMCSYVAAYIRRHPEYAELTNQQAGE